MVEMGVVVMLTSDLQLCSPCTSSAGSGAGSGTASTAAASDVKAEDVGVCWSSWSITGN
jgi:hypothetical protein